MYDTNGNCKFIRAVEEAFFLLNRDQNRSVNSDDSCTIGKSLGIELDINETLSLIRTAIREQTDDQYELVVKELLIQANNNQDIDLKQNDESIKSINGEKITNALVDSWFDTNEMFITKKNFSPDRYSVEITFVDEERAEMMLDLLSTCYSDFISISRPQNLIPSLDNSFEEEREPSPVHLSSAMSTSSRVSCFSQRLIELDKSTNSHQRSPAKGRGRGIERPFINERDDDALETSSMINSSNISSVSGRGRGAIFK